jgi:hypothetical protein
MLLPPATHWPWLFARCRFPCPELAPSATYANFGNFGMRIVMSYTPSQLQQQFTVDCLYGVGVLRNNFGSSGYQRNPAGPDSPAASKPQPCRRGAAHFKGTHDHTGLLEKDPGDCRRVRPRGSRSATRQEEEPRLTAFIFGPASGECMDHVSRESRRRGASGAGPSKRGHISRPNAFSRRRTGRLYRRGRGRSGRSPAARKRESAKSRKRSATRKGNHAKDTGDSMAAAIR